MKKLANKTKKLILALSGMCFSLVSISTATYAWFTSASRNATVSNAAITVLGGDGLSFKYFVHNKTGAVDSGYDFYERSSLIDDDPNYYTTNFVSSADASINITHLTPKAAFTFAFEITNNTSSTVETVSLLSFLCNNSKTNTVTREGSNRIYLSEAIDIYFSSYTYGASEDLNQITKDFINVTSPVDEFTSYAGSGSNLSLTEFSYGSEPRMIIFMTLLCSNDSSTYYEETTSNPVTYTKSILGDSNVYKGLDISFSSFNFVGRVG